VPSRAAAAEEVGVDPTAVLVTFALILPAELPDKTFVATLVLSTRFRPLVVWLAVVTAFGVQSAIAVTAGQLLALLPHTAVLLVTSALFATGAVLMLRSASHTEQDLAEEEAEVAARTSRTSSSRAFLVSFAVLFAAEWGDLSQLTTASLSARFDDPMSVFLGAWLALATVAGLAVLGGRWLQTRLHFSTVRRLSGALLGVLAVVTLLEAVGASPL
jgi:Ca2+/H+ antiporter, TMEM165/GDT1 family